MKGQPTEIWQIYNKANSTLEIPVYQRNYDWGTLQCSRLFDDLETLAYSDREKGRSTFSVPLLESPKIPGPGSLLTASSVSPRLVFSSWPSPMQSPTKMLKLGKTPTWDASLSMTTCWSMPIHTT